MGGTNRAKHEKPSWREAGLKRSHRAYYYDRETGEVGRASVMPSCPHYRPRRYLFLGFFRSCQVVTINTKRVREQLKKALIKPPRNKAEKDLPF